MSETEKKRVSVVAAAIQHEGKILCVQRGENKYEYISKKWEFPGGKIEENETNEEALIREIQEELGMEITVNSWLITVEHEYPNFHLTMATYLCESLNNQVNLTEHLDYKWLLPSEMKLDWAGADVPIVHALQKL